MSMQPLRKLGIMGGTFDPIHYGHLILGQQAYEQYGLDRVDFMPTGISYLKEGTGVSESDLRAQMVREAIRGVDHFALDDREIRRPGKTYTYETLLEMKKEYGNEVALYFILGADSLLSMDQWKNIQIIFDLCTVLVAPRSGYEATRLQSKADEYRRTFGAQIGFLESPVTEISSTDIRNRIKAGYSAAFLTPESVLQIIGSKELYHS